MFIIGKTTPEKEVDGIETVEPAYGIPSRWIRAETIPLGDVSFGQKSVSLFKIGKGFKLTDEVCS